MQKSLSDVLSNTKELPVADLERMIALSKVAARLSKFTTAERAWVQDRATFLASQGPANPDDRTTSTS